MDTYGRIGGGIVLFGGLSWLLYNLYLTIVRGHCHDRMLRIRVIPYGPVGQLIYAALLNLGCSFFLFALYFVLFVELKNK